MLSQIEELVLGGNVAHDLIYLAKANGYWIITVSPIYDLQYQENFWLL